LGVIGEQFILEGWFRTYGSEDAIGIIQVEDFLNPQNLQINCKVESDGSIWKRVRFSFGIPPNTKTISVSIYKIEGDGIDWDDINIKVI